MLILEPNTILWQKETDKGGGGENKMLDFTEGARGRAADTCKRRMHPHGQGRHSHRPPHVSNPCFCSDEVACSRLGTRLFCLIYDSLYPSIS